MPEPHPSQATLLLNRVVAGDAGAAEQLFPLVYDKLRLLADDLLRRERRDHTLQPTALVHEAYVRLSGTTQRSQEEHEGPKRARFAAIAARAMREILVEHARRKKALKRGGDWERITLAGVTAGDPEFDVLALHDALGKLQGVHPRAAHAMELNVFANMTGQEIADVLGVSRRTVSKDLMIAQGWLVREMERAAAE